MDNAEVIYALAGVISTLAGVIFHELRDSRNSEREVNEKLRDQLRLSTETMRDLSVYVKDSLPLLTEIKIRLPEFTALLQRVDDRLDDLEQPVPPTTRRRTS